MTKIVYCGVYVFVFHYSATVTNVRLSMTALGHLQPLSIHPGEQLVSARSGRSQHLRNSFLGGQKSSHLLIKHGSNLHRSYADLEGLGRLSLVQLLELYFVVFQKR